MSTADYRWLFIIVGGFILVLFVANIGLDKRITKLQEDNQRKSDSLSYMSKTIDTLKQEIKKADLFKSEKYSEQCRVDSIQDAYVQVLNIRTAPLLDGAE
jgi:hypothetical protein